MDIDHEGALIEPEIPEKDKTAITESQTRGPAFYGALALVGFLVLLIVWYNALGIRASSGMLLTQNTWTLRSYVDSGGVLVPAIPGIPVTARFRTDGSVSGSGGCNTYNASYTTKDLAMSISQLVMTDISCENSHIMQQESEYINDLVNAHELRVNELSLNLYDKTGKPVLMFVAT